MKMTKRIVLVSFMICFLLCLAGCYHSPVLKKRVFTVPGNNTDMVVYRQSSGHYEIAFFEKGNHSKRLDNHVVANANLLSITVVDGTKDYYISGLISAYDTGLVVLDSFGTDFHIELLNQSKDDGAKNGFFVCGFLAEYGGEYSFVVNGEIVEFVRK